MFNREQNHVSKIWVLGLFGALAFNVSALPGTSGSSSLSSSASSSECLQLKLDAGELADCNLEYVIDGKTVKVTAHAELKTVASSHLDRETGEMVAGKPVKEVDVTFGPAETECAVCEGGSSQAKLGNIAIQLKQLDDLHNQVDKLLADQGGKLVKATKDNEVAQAEVIKKNAALKQQQDFCLRDAQGQPITDVKAQATCGLDHLRTLQKKDEAAAYYELVVHPKLEELAKSDKVADRSFAKNMIDELAIDPSNAGNEMLAKSVSELRTFAKYQDTAHVLKEAIDSPVTQVQVKQQAQAQLNALKADWKKYYTAQADLDLKSPTPDGLTTNTYNKLLTGEIAGFTDASGARLTEGYERELDFLVDAHSDAIAATAAGRSARGTTNLLPSIAAATSSAVGSARTNVAATSTTAKKQPSPILVGSVNSLAPGVVPVSGQAATPAPGFSGGLSARCLGCAVGSTTATGK